MMLDSMVRTGDFKGEKHVPVIEAPEAVAKGSPFQVTVSVGKEIPHPNTTEHFIAWIDLFFKPASGGFPYHVGRFDFRAHGESVKGPNQGPVHAHPSVTFPVSLNEPGTLVAVSLCNIHGLWESSREVAVEE